MGTKTYEAFLESQTKVTPERVAEIEAEARAFSERRQLTLAELRKARALTQVTVAENAEMKQSEVSRLERRADAYVGTLRRYIEALGGDMQIVVSFPDGEAVEVMGFGDANDDADTTESKELVGSGN